MTLDQKEEQRMMAYTLEAKEATRMVRIRYGGTLTTSLLVLTSACVSESTPRVRDPAQALDRRCG